MYSHVSGSDHVKLQVLVPEVRHHLPRGVVVRHLVLLLEVVSHGDKPWFHLEIQLEFVKPFVQLDMDCFLSMAIKLPVGSVDAVQ